jgi:hypothetical protein
LLARAMIAGRFEATVWMATRASVTSWIWSRQR